MIRPAYRWFSYVLAACALSVTVYAFAAPVDDWTIAGPFGGTARSLAADPQRPGVLLAGGMNSLVFRSRDSGENWSLLDFPKRNLSEITSLLIDPTDSNHYWAGMISAGDGGLFESHDEGKSWDQVKQLSKFGVRALTVAPSDPTEILAGTLQGVWLSSNSGKDWKRVSDPDNLEMQGITVVAVDSKDPKIIYAGTSHLPWKTIDGGKTWQSIHTGMIDDSDVFSIFVDPANPAAILASACSGIYSSPSRGDEWKKLLGIPNTSRRTHVIRQDPSDPNMIYAGTTTGLFKSLNHGGTWKTLSDTQANTIVFDPLHAGRMYLALEYEGIGRSDNNGETIQLVNRGFVDRSISSETRAGDKLVAIETQEGETSGIFSSSDHGENWNRLTGVRGLSGVHLKAITGLPSQSDVLVGATPRRMFKSTNGGMLWKLLPVRIVEPPPPPADKSKAPVTRRPQRRGSAASSTPVRTRRAVKPVPKIREVSLSEISGLYGLKNEAQDLLFAATDLGLLKSTDAGEHWMVAPIAGSPAVSALYSAPESGKYLIARTATGLWASKDCGDHWTELSFPLPPSEINQIAVNPMETDKLLAATRLGLYVSSDGGAKWNPSTKGMPASTVSSVLFANREGTAYAVEYGQLYETADSGASWKEVPSALPAIHIRQLWMPDLATGRLYGITSDLGILFRDRVTIR